VVHTDVSIRKDIMQMIIGVRYKSRMIQCLHGFHLLCIVQRHKYVIKNKKWCPAGIVFLFCLS